MKQQPWNERALNRIRASDPVYVGNLTLKNGDREHEVRELSIDEIFEVLYNRRRRDIITYLLDRDDSATASDLAEYIAAKENDIPIQQLSSAERKRVYVALYQNHLPKMDSIGVIDYEKNRGTVQLNDTVTQFVPYLDDSVESKRRNGTVAGALALACVILLGVLNVGPFALLPEQVWVGLGTSGFFGLVIHDTLGFLK